MEKKKIIFDLVHNYIEIDKDIEKIINSESFQRLKFINQLTAQHLYPSANHTRFEHSLGVMKLSLLFFNKIQHLLQEMLEKEKTEFFEDNLHILEIHLKYAALLHDIGHAPLSHVGEYFYSKEDIIDKINIELSNASMKFPTNFLKKGSLHEIMSCYVIIKIFRSLLLEIYGQFDFEFIFRIIVGVKYNKSNKKNIIITIVNSETIDADKLDYLIRDNFMTGNVGPQVDLERLLMSLTISGNELSFMQIGLSALQKVIDCRDNIYMWVCNHHTVVYTDYLYRECFKHFNNLFNLPEKFEEELSIDELFSCNAIVERCVSDNDALFYIKKAMRLVKKNATKSQYTKNIVTQLENRNFLKPTWKTLFEYVEYMNSTFSDKDRKKVIKYLEDEKNRIKIVKYFVSKLNIKLGNLFIIARENKFYCDKMENIYINIKGEEKELSKLLPPRDYKKLYDGIAFYIFCEKNKEDLIKQTFKEYFNKIDFDQ
jgi:HD superfamily phosphohydrolase